MIDKGSESEKIVLDWLHENYKQCAVCGDNQFSVDAVVAMPVINEKAAIDLKTSFNCVPIVCRSCGYTIIVSATAIRLAVSKFEQNKKAKPQ